MKYDLSVLIPSRNELFLGRTIEDLLANIEGNTEIIAVLDGAPSLTPLPIDSRLTVVSLPESIGQRAATNLAAKLSKSKYVMKVDAHCAFDQGFDVKLMADMEDSWTVVPLMKNLHAFDWVCPEGHRRYQGPSGPCTACGKETTRDVVWIAKDSPKSTSYRFDRTLHFQYFNEYTHRPEYQGDLSETMSLQGSCFMMTREKYWELDICDENHGSWGQQGVEVACKTWLSGGRVICNKKTWYAHMFRTQGGDFGFPYELKGSSVEHARKYSRELFLENKWPKAIHPLQWLIDRFAPVPDWNMGTKGVVYISDVRLDEKLLKDCQKQLLKAFPGKIVSVTLKPVDFGENIVLPLKREKLSIFKQILAGLEAIDTDYVFLCDDDVLYHPSHFDFTPPRDDVFYYDINWWRLRTSDGTTAHWKAKQSNLLCANRKFLIQEYKERVRKVESEGWHNGGYEPGTRSIRRGGFSDSRSEYYKAELPTIDLRHGKNLTGDKWKVDDFVDKRQAETWGKGDVNTISGWDNLSAIIG